MLMSVQSQMKKTYDKTKTDIPDNRKIAYACYLIHLGIIPHLKERGLASRTISNKDKEAGNYENAEYIFY